MSQELRTSVTAAFGLLLLGLVTSGGFRSYVRPSMGPWLALAGLALGMLAGLSAVDQVRRSRPVRRRQLRANELHPHHGARSQALAVVPLLLLAVIPPTPLGAAAASMRAGTFRTRTTSLFPPLPPAVDGAVPLSMSAFVGRGLYDADGSLHGVIVRLVGFVASDPGDPPGGFELMRFAIFCCAADAVPMGVHVRGASSRAPPNDAWVEVTGILRPAPTLPPGLFDPKMMPTLDATSVRPVAEPSNPYDPPL